MAYYAAKERRRLLASRDDVWPKFRLALPSVVGQFSPRLRSSAAAK
jgi:hypothetical protein